MLTRRQIMMTGAATLAGGALSMTAGGANEDDLVSDGLPADAEADGEPAGPLAPGEPGKHYTPVVNPNGTTLPYKLVDGVKVFHLIAEPCKREFTKGLVVNCWGYNGQTPGPLIEAVEGDRVRIYVTNSLPAPTSVHWHGVLLPNGMDGVGALTQKPIEPGQTFKYEFTLRQSGTCMYHPHFDEMTQIAMGMTGMFVIHPRQPRRPKVDRDFGIMLAEWQIRAGTSTPDVNAMSDFNVLTMNSKAFPGTDPLVVRTGERVRIRLGNLSIMTQHPIHLHGYHFRVTGNDAGPIPESAQQPGTTVIVPVGATRDIEFIADAPGDWPLHCHMVHHMMNQMGHASPGFIGMNIDGLEKKIRTLLPGYMTMGHEGMGGHGKHMEHMGVPENSVPMKGADGPFGYIDMGGMFTILKVRDDIDTYDDPGWYDHPAGTVADVATAEQMQADGIELE